MSTQLTLGGEHEAVIATVRKGCVGKVERYIYAYPWLSVGEIAKKIGEPPARVSNALNVLKHESKAAQENGLGPRGGAVWASTSETCSLRRESGLILLRAQHNAKVGEKLAVKMARVGLTAAAPDWHPDVTAEDYAQ